MLSVFTFSLGEVLEATPLCDSWFNLVREMSKCWTLILLDWEAMLDKTSTGTPMRTGIFPGEKFLGLCANLCAEKKKCEQLGAEAGRPAAQRGLKE